MAVNEELLAFAADLANELERHEGRAVSYTHLTLPTTPYV